MYVSIRTSLTFCFLFSPGGLLLSDVGISISEFNKDHWEKTGNRCFVLASFRGVSLILHTFLFIHYYESYIIAFTITISMLCSPIVHSTSCKQPASICENMAWSIHPYFPILQTLECPCSAIRRFDQQYTSVCTSGCASQHYQVHATLDERIKNTMCIWVGSSGKYCEFICCGDDRARYAHFLTEPQIPILLSAPSSLLRTVLACVHHIYNSSSHFFPSSILQLTPCCCFDCITIITASLQCPRFGMLHVDHHQKSNHPTDVWISSLCKPHMLMQTVYVNNRCLWSRVMMRKKYMVVIIT